jgi:serine/threonine-protein kinase HipA
MAGCLCIPFAAESAVAFGLMQGQRITLAPADVEETITTLTDMTETVVAEVDALLPAAFPNDVSDRIFEGLLQQSSKLAAQ